MGELDEMREKIAKAIFCAFPDDYGLWEGQYYPSIRQACYDAADQILCLQTDICRIAMARKEAELPNVASSIIITGETQCQ